VFNNFVQVKRTIGRWVLENAKVYSPLSGVTTNQSEGFNTKIVSAVPVDLLVHDLYHFQLYYHNKIQHGYCGFG